MGVSQATYIVRTLIIILKLYIQIQSQLLHCHGSTVSVYQAYTLFFAINFKLTGDFVDYMASNGRLGDQTGISNWQEQNVHRN